MRTSLLLLGALLLAACAAPSPKGIPADSIGLSKAGVEEVPEPPPYSPLAAEPGEATPQEPAYPGSPPVIAHAIADFLPITVDSNACVDCHGGSEGGAGEPTPIPASHYVDLRNAPADTAEEVVGSRWVCTSCHAVQTDAAPLVVNTFQRSP